MTAIDPLDEQKAVRLRQRLWGAAVLIALLVIFLPLLLDGAGSESQYRRVERLRAEPPRIVGADGVPEAVETVKQNEPVVVEPEPTASSEPVASIGGNDLSDSTALPEVAETVIPNTEPAPTRIEPTARSATEPLTAWVVQAGSFGDEANALAVRDKLRRAGFPSFVTPTDSATPLYRVRVGPMINLQQAEANRDKVVRLLGRDAIVVSYP